MNTPNTQVLNAYLEAVYFTETGDLDQPEATAKLTPYDRVVAYSSCRRFVQAVQGLPLQLQPENLDNLWPQIGHDLWLTRNGHGVGFWDRPEVYGEVPAQILTAMATAAGEHEVSFD